MSEDSRIVANEIIKPSVPSLRQNDTQVQEGVIKSIKENTSPEELYQDLISHVRKYHPSDDISLIEKAYKTAAEAHKNQVRKSGEPYIVHPLCVSWLHYAY